MCQDHPRMGHEKDVKPWTSSDFMNQIHWYGEDSWRVVASGWTFPPRPPHSCAPVAPPRISGGCRHGLHKANFPNFQRLVGWHRGSFNMFQPPGIFGKHWSFTLIVSWKLQTYGRFRALGYIKIKTMGFRIKNMLKLHKLPILDHLGVLHFHNFHDPINQVCTMGCHGAPRSNHIQWHSPAMMPL